jgi:hypothetical protein
MNTIQSLKEKIDELQLERIAIIACRRALEQYIEELTKIMNKLDQKEV